MLDSLTLNLFSDEAVAELTQNRASSGPDEQDSDLTQFAYLDESARSKAKEVARMGRLHQAAWDELIPILDEMQNLLSQRGADHAQAVPGLPEWRVWWGDFSTKYQLNVSFRTVQDRLRAYREVPDGEKPVRPRVTRAEQRQLAATAKLAYGLVAAIKAGEGTDDALDVFLRESLSPEHVDQIEKRFTSDFKEPDPSDKTALGKAMIAMAGPQIKTCLDGLGPNEARDALQNAFSKIVAKFCRGGKISVSVKCSERSVSPEKPELITIAFDHHAA
jgi:hypothetical protein